MDLKIKLIDSSLPTPAYKTEGAAAFDLYSRVDMEIPSFKPTIIPANIVAQVPKGYFLMIAARSSLPKTGLMLANGVGVVDEDYCGDDDEIGIFVINVTPDTVKVEKGQRLAQALLVKITRADKLVPVKQMNSRSRGGFGSTGK